MLKSEVYGDWNNVIHLPKEVVSVRSTHMQDYPGIVIQTEANRRLKTKYHGEFRSPMFRMFKNGAFNYVPKFRERYVQDGKLDTDRVYDNFMKNAKYPKGAFILLCVKMDLSKKEKVALLKKHSKGDDDFYNLKNEFKVNSIQ